MRIAKTLCLIPAFAVAGITTSAAAAGVVPGFWQLESDYHATGNVTTATSALISALPYGTGMSVAQQSLETVGASCKPVKQGSGSIKCLLRQVFLIDDGATVVRWTVLCRARNGEVADVSVDRYVDRHRRG